MYNEAQQTITKLFDQKEWFLPQWNCFNISGLQELYDQATELLETFDEFAIGADHSFIFVRVDDALQYRIFFNFTIFHLETYDEEAADNEDYLDLILQVLPCANGKNLCWTVELENKLLNSSPNFYEELYSQALLAVIANAGY